MQVNIQNKIDSLTKAYSQSYFTREIIFSFLVIIVVQVYKIERTLKLGLLVIPLPVKFVIEFTNNLPIKY